MANPKQTRCPCGRFMAKGARVCGFCGAEQDGDGNAHYPASPEALKADAEAAAGGLRIGLVLGAVGTI